MFYLELFVSFYSLLQYVYSFWITFPHQEFHIGLENMYPGNWNSQLLFVPLYCQCRRPTR